MSGENGSAPISSQGSLKSKRKNIGGQSRNLKKNLLPITYDLGYGSDDMKISKARKA